MAGTVKAGMREWDQHVTVPSLRRLTLGRTAGQLEYCFLPYESQEREDQRLKSSSKSGHDILQNTTEFELWIVNLTGFLLLPLMTQH